jgi:hypothetical protein
MWIFLLHSFTLSGMLLSKQMHTGGGIMEEKDEKREVIQHSAAIHIQNNITLLQCRDWNVLLHNAYDDLLGGDEYCIVVKTLTQILEFDSKNEDYLKESLKALTTCGVDRRQTSV